MGGLCLVVGILLRVAVDAAVWADTVAYSAPYAGVLAYWWYCAGKRGFSFWGSIGGPPRRVHFVPLLWAGVAIAGVRLGWASTLMAWGEPVEQGSLTLDSVQGFLLYSVLTVLDPVAEEILFRGLLFWRLSQKAGPLVAALLSSVLFGVLHSDPVGSVLLGFTLIGLYASTGTLWVPILAHALLNGLAPLLVSRSVWPFVVAHSQLVWALQVVFVPLLLWHFARSLKAFRGLAFAKCEPHSSS